jgi:hypothetical protein
MSRLDGSLFHIDHLRIAAETGHHRHHHHRPKEYDYVLCHVNCIGIQSSPQSAWIIDLSNSVASTNNEQEHPLEQQDHETLNCLIDDLASSVFQEIWNQKCFRGNNNNNSGLIRDDQFLIMVASLSNYKTCCLHHSTNNHKNKMARHFYGGNNHNGTWLTLQQYIQLNSLK